MIKFEIQYDGYDRIIAIRTKQKIKSFVWVLLYKPEEHRHDNVYRMFSMQENGTWKDININMSNRHSILRASILVYHHIRRREENM
jgi:hypothetical protein